MIGLWMKFYILASQCLVNNLVINIFISSITLCHHTIIHQNYYDVNSIRTTLLQSQKNSIRVSIRMDFVAKPKKINQISFVQTNEIRFYFIIKGHLDPKKRVRKLSLVNPMYHKTARRVNNLSMIIMMVSALNNKLIILVCSYSLQSRCHQGDRDNASVCCPQCTFIYIPINEMS